MEMNEIFVTAPEMDPFDCFTEEEKEIARIKAEIAVAIRRKRAELDMSQVAFAEAIGESQSSVSKWESGEYTLSLKTMARILIKLGMTVSITANDYGDNAECVEATVANNYTYYHTPEPQYA